MWCVNISASTPYAQGSLMAIIHPRFWGRDFGPGFSFLYLLTTQMIGFGLAGLARRWIVYPAALIWPTSLSSTVLFRALHEREDRSPANGWTITRYRFFAYFTIFGFVLFWFPDYIWTSLSSFAFITWIVPHNQVVNTLFGSYNITKVVDANLNFVESKYQAYSPMYISMAYALTYGLGFAAVTAVIVHTYLYNGREIWAKLKNARAGGEDIHRRLMHAYNDVPDWWYGILTVIVLGLGVLTVRYWDTELPVWGFLVVCFGMGVVLILPEGILQGTTNQRVFLNIITELIAGYAYPGSAIANTMVKCYGYNSIKHAMDFAQDLKMGQYMPVVTVIVYLLYRRYPTSWLKYVNVPIFFNAAGNIPPATTNLLQAAMDTGTALATILIFFALSYTGTKLSWWGNNVGSNTYDSQSVPYLKVSAGGHFGPGPGEFK
ncbi:hypothetical protein APSETT445_001245 [Aspergillus pseudonomiae]